MLQKFFKKPNTFWLIVIGIFLSYIIVGVGVYLWQHDIVTQAKIKTENTLTELNQEKLDLENETATLEKSIQDKWENYKNNVIDLETVKVGDKLANGMIVTETDHISAVSFSGSVVLKGEYLFSADKDFFLYDSVCFKPDDESYLILPKMDNDKPAICFSNQDVAKNRYGPRGSQGEATIIIDNFIIKTPFAGAELIKTIKKN